MTANIFMIIVNKVQNSVMDDRIFKMPHPVKSGL